MPRVTDTDVCPVCGEKFWYDFDCRTGEYSKITMCACDRRMWDAEEFLKMKGLYEEFVKFHEERENERKKTYGEAKLTF